jgi:ATP-binding cassette subfamily F protein uup
VPRAAGEGADRAARAPSSGAAAADLAAAVAKPRKLSYKEQRELDALPDRIDALEAEQKTLAERLADPALYADEPAQAAAAQARYQQIEGELMDALERWEALGSRAG